MSFVSFHKDLKLAFSDASDGSMASGGGMPSTLDHSRNNDEFLKKHEFPLERSRIFVTYDDEREYIDIVRVDDENVGSDIKADALYTTDTDKVLTLPVADCVATVVYDPVTGMLGLLHLGRHSSVAGLIEHFILEVADRLGSDPRDWHVWMSPSLRQANDRLDFFGPADTDEWRDFVRREPDGFYVDTVGHNRARFVRAGVPEESIIISPDDTFDNAKYFSHRAANVAKNDARQGRMMLAVMKQS